jgi:DNA-binding XRE family transcriptional regulator
MINPEKLKGMKTAGQLFDEKYGNEGTESRREFNAKAQAWYYAELLKEERKKQKISQAQLANIIGKSRTYITALEKGQTDMQLSTFLMLSHALGLNFSLVVG